MYVGKSRDPSRKEDPEERATRASREHLRPSAVVAGSKRGTDNNIERQLRLGRGLLEAPRLCLDHGSPPAGTRPDRPAATGDPAYGGYPPEAPD